MHVKNLLSRYSSYTHSVSKLNIEDQVYKFVLHTISFFLFCRLFISFPVDNDTKFLDVSDIESIDDLLKKQNK